MQYGLESSGERFNIFSQFGMPFNHNENHPSTDLWYTYPIEICAILLHNKFLGFDIFLMKTTVYKCIPRSHSPVVDLHGYDVTPLAEEASQLILRGRVGNVADKDLLGVGVRGIASAGWSRGCRWLENGQYGSYMKNRYSDVMGKPLG